ncbi:MAG: DUF5989 family protein, partial [Dolichospermum sp.]
MPNSVNELFNQVERLKQILVSRATSNFDEGDNEEYEKLRLNLLQIPRINNQMPECVKKCRDLKEFWDFLKVRKKYWLLPILIVLILFGSLIVLSQGTAVAPFIYTIF